MVKSDWYGTKQKRNMFDAMHKGVVGAGQQIEGSQKKLSPVDTGAMRGTITHETSGLTTKSGVNIEYSYYNEGVPVQNRYHMTETEAQDYTLDLYTGEFGSRGRSPQPFIRTGLLVNIKSIMANMKRLGGKAIAR